MRTSHFAVVVSVVLAGAAIAPLACSSSSDGEQPTADTGTDANPNDANPNDAGADANPSDAGGDLARGEYLVDHVLVCGDCHSTPNVTGLPSLDPKDYLAGGRDFTIKKPDGTEGHVYSRNITSDPKNGIGTWSVETIKRALTKGLDDEGQPLYPWMPYQMFGLLNDYDLTSVAMYIKTVPPSANTTPDDTVTVAAPAPPYDDAKIPQTTLSPSDPEYAAAQRGRYIARAVCIDCHTNSPPGQLDYAHAFAGGQEFDIPPIIATTANLTPDPSGLAGWTVDQIAATLKSGREKGTGRNLCPPMPAGGDDFGKMNDGDLHDVATFIHSLAPKANPITCNVVGCCPIRVPADAGTDAAAETGTGDAGTD